MDKGDRPVHPGCSRPERAVHRVRKAGRDSGGLNELLSKALPDTPDLSAMTKAEMLQFADKNGVSGVNSSMRKADILTAIQGAV